MTGSKVYRRLLVAGLMSGLAFPASASLFNGDFNSYWVINTDTGEITPGASGHWEAAYDRSLYIPAANEQVLVNSLPASSAPMTSPQPVLSVIGLQDVNGDASNSGLNISPANGVYDGTVRVVMEALTGSPATTLRWRINAGDWQSQAITSERRDAAATLIENGSYVIEAQLFDGAQLLASSDMLYTVASDHPRGKHRDTDNDGIPDMVEAALGLNALTQDAGYDRDGDGWSDIDTYIRCGVVKAEDIPAECDAMEDDDGDGWSNFDEDLRGTRSDDPIAVLPDTYGEINSEAYYQAQQRYREFPAARRLYEREYLIPESRVSDRLFNLQATTFAGAPLWHSNALLTADMLTDANLTEAQVQPSLLATTAALALEGSRLPSMRAPAGSGVFLRGDSAGVLRAAMTYLPPVGDATFAGFSSNPEASSDWSSALEWRDSLVKWLEKELVISGAPGFDDTTTLSLLMLEQALRDEATEREESRLLELGNSARQGAWLSLWLNEHRQRFPTATPADFPGDCFFRGDSFFPDGCDVSVSPFAQLILNLQSSLEGPMAEDSAKFQQWITDLPSGEEPLSDWLSYQLYNADVDALAGCQVRTSYLEELQQDAERFAEFQAECPEYHTEIDLAAALGNQADIRHRLRLALLPEGMRQLSINSSLASHSEDSDNDGLNNRDELRLFGTVNMALPWLADSDSDGTDDIVDLCPADTSNTCYGDNRVNQIALETSEIQSFQRLNGDSSALVAVQLTRPALSDICVQYDVSTLTGTPALNTTGEVCFSTGQSVALISVILPEDGSNEAATLLVALTDINDPGNTGNYALGTDLTQELAFEPAPDLDPTTAIASVSSPTAGERSTVQLIGSGSSAGDGGSLTYLWEQTAGPDARLGSSTAADSSLTLPEVLSETALGFRLTVTDSLGDRASADISIRVLPVEDAPEQTATPVFALTQDSDLILTPEQLSAYLREPDGDPLSFGELVDVPASINAARDGSHYVLSVSAAGGIEALPKRSSRDLRPWQNGVAWISMAGNDNLPFGIWSWTPEEGTELIYEATDGSSFGGLLTISDNPAMYFDSYDPTIGGTLINRVDNGTVTSVAAPDFNGVQGNAIAPDGGLYYCGYGGNWQILDRDTGTFSDSGIGCSNYEASAVALGNRICLAAIDTVACSAGDGSSDLTPVFTGNPDYTTSLGRLFSVGDNVLLTRNVQVIEEGFYKYYVDLSILDLAGGVSSLGLMPVGFGYRVLQTGSELVVIGQGMDSDSDKFMAWRWQSGDTALTEISTDLLAGYLSDVSGLYLSEAALLNEQIVFSVTGNYQDYYLFSSDNDGNVVDVSINNFAGNIRPWNNRLMLSVSNGSGEGVCHWYEYTSDAGLNPDALLQDVNCYTTQSLDDAFVFGQYDEDVGGTYFSIYRQGVTPGLYSLGVPVDDGKGNSIVMEIQIEIQSDVEGGQP